jgi:predicted TIM-barrel fold metal-dependent hydrolase
MPLQDHMKLISVDDHVIEHPRVWTDRASGPDIERVPHVVELDEGIVGRLGESIPKGSEVWVFEGRMYPQTALNATAGRPFEERGLEPRRFDQIRPGCYDPAERVKDMDTDGVQAELGFPTLPRFAGTLFLESVDKELGLRCVQAYNDFILDEWCGYAPDRLIPMVIAPLWDPDLAAAELQRTVAKGAKALAFPENPVPLGLPSFHTTHWDPLFAVAEEAGTPLCMHFGTSGQSIKTAPEAPESVFITLMGCNSMFCLTDLVFSPLLHRFDRLKVMLAEGGIGWIPWLLERMDHTWERHRWYQEVNRDVLPSSLFRKHFWGCFIDDMSGILQRHEIGIDRITWESDYPHSDSNFPHARKAISEMLVDVPDDEAHRIVELNAREVLCFDADL